MSLLKNIFGSIFIATLLVLPSVVQAGVITDAPPLLAGLTNILNFLLLIFGAIAILGLIVAGVLYFTASGDPRRVAVAKRALVASVMGILIVLGSMVLIWTIGLLLS